MAIDPERSETSNGQGNGNGDAAAPRGPARAGRGRSAARSKAATMAAAPTPASAAVGRGSRAARRTTPAALAIAEEAQGLLNEANANTQALIDSIAAVIRAETIDELVRTTLDTIRKEFGLAYASYWTVDPADRTLCFAMESGRVDGEFQRLTRSARFREGEGLNGRAWRQRDLFHVEDIGELRDCCRAPLAHRAGIRTAVALPLLRDGEVVGTLDFFADQTVEISTVRIEALRTIGRLSSDRMSKLARQGELTRIKQMVDNAPVNMMYADLDLKIRYMNPRAEQTLRRLEAHLPVKVDQMIGSSIDVFHKAPEYQRRLLADLRNLPRTATINVGPELFELTVAAMLDPHEKFIGPMITWEVITEKVETARREAETAADVRAVNQLLWRSVGRAPPAT
ncbi:MAG: GAF domain-containing protein [Isosphaeraceae bacterium]